MGERSRARRGNSINSAFGCATPRAPSSRLPTTRFGFELSPTFAYDGTNNLIVEVWWEGDDDRGGYVFTADVREQLRCLLSSIKNGVPLNGYPDGGLACNWLHYMRLTLSPDAVAPTSLGRVKALYR